MTKEEWEDLLHVLGLDYEAEASLIYLFYVTPDGFVRNFSISVNRGSKMNDKQLEQLMREQYPSTRSGALLHVERPGTPQSQWLDIADVCGMLHISRKTLRNWTRRGLFSPSVIGGRIYYSLNEINHVLTSNVIQENGRLDNSHLADEACEKEGK